jgi:hypothetical protein
VEVRCPTISPNIVIKKTAQRKQLLNGRNFAQSGHPAKESSVPPHLLDARFNKHFYKFVSCTKSTLKMFSSISFLQMLAIATMSTELILTELHTICVQKPKLLHPGWGFEPGMFCCVTQIPLCHGPQFMYVHRYEVRMVLQWKSFCKLTKVVNSDWSPF